MSAGAFPPTSWRSTRPRTSNHVPEFAGGFSGLLGRVTTSGKPRAVATAAGPGRSHRWPGGRTNRPGPTVRFLIRLLRLIRIRRCVFRPCPSGRVPVPAAGGPGCGVSWPRVPGRCRRRRADATARRAVGGDRAGGAAVVPRPGSAGPGPRPAAQAAPRRGRLRLWPPLPAWPVIVDGNPRFVSVPNKVPFRRVGGRGGGLMRRRGRDRLGAGRCPALIAAFARYARRVSPVRAGVRGPPPPSIAMPGT